MLEGRGLPGHTLAPPPMTQAQTPASPDLQRLQDRIDDLERERARLLGLIEILRDVSGTLHYHDIVQAVARRLGHLFGLDRCSVFLTSRTGGEGVHLVASYEDPSIRNHVVDLSRYPEIRTALETGQVVYIPDVMSDPSLAMAATTLESRRVRSITVVPMAWQGQVIGALFLRTYREGPRFSEDDVAFSQVVAEVTAGALRLAYKLERLQTRDGAQDLLVANKERAALLLFLRRLLAAYSDRDHTRGGDEILAEASGEEVERLVGVALTVVSQEAGGR